MRFLLREKLSAREIYACGRGLLVASMSRKRATLIIIISSSSSIIIIIISSLSSTDPVVGDNMFS